jgi:hypothetical protein
VSLFDDHLSQFQESLRLTHSPTRPKQIATMRASLTFSPKYALVSTNGIPYLSGTESIEHLVV